MCKGTIAATVEDSPYGGNIVILDDLFTKYSYTCYTGSRGQVSSSADSLSSAAVALRTNKHQSPSTKPQAKRCELTNFVDCRPNVSDNSAKMSRAATTDQLHNSSLQAAHS